MRDILAGVVMVGLTVALLIGFLNILFFLTVAAALLLCIVTLALPFVWVFKRWKAWVQERRIRPIRESLDCYIEATEPPKWQGVNRISKYYEDVV
jgi:hypothetical protein